MLFFFFLHAHLLLLITIVWCIHCCALSFILYRVEVQSKTLPSGSPKLTPKAATDDKEKKKSKHASPTDGDSSPRHGHGHSAFAKLFRRKDKGRSHSIQEFDMKQREEKKSGKKGAKISFPVRSKDTLSVVSVLLQ